MLAKRDVANPLEEEGRQDPTCFTVGSELPSYRKNPVDVCMVPIIPKYSCKCSISNSHGDVLCV